jgi:outer membrane receptor protein involved in Fe transport
MRKILLVGILFLNYFIIQAENTVSDSIKIHYLDEVNVTASAKETNNLRTLPGSVTILTPSQIEKMRVQTIKDLSMIVPNFFIPDYGSKLSTPVYIRGIGERASGQTIGLYVDNMPYMDKATFDFNFTDIQRIEVFRGPQGTLYGRNAMGGIVNIHTRSPLNYDRMKVQLSAGNYGLIQAKIMESHRINDNVGMAVSGYFDSNDGYFTNQYTGKKADELKAIGGRLRLDWKTSDQLKFQFVANYDYLDQGAFPYGKVDSIGNIADPNYNHEGSYRREIVGTGLNISYENKHFLLTSSTGFQYFNDNMKMDTDYSPLSMFSINQKQRQNAISQEVNIKSNNNNNYQWSFGTMGFYNQLHTSTPTTFGEDGVKNILSPMINIGGQTNPRTPIFTIKDETVVVPGDFKTPSYGAAIFHQSTYNNLFIEGLSTTVGIRLDYEKAELEYYSSMLINTDMSFPTVPNRPPTSMVLDTVMQGNLSANFTQLLPKFALKYELDENKYIYISAANGYKSGGYNVNMFADLSQSAFREKYDATFDKVLSVQDAAFYKPELSWNYEIGFKGELIKNLLYSEVAAYYIDVKNIQLTQFVASGQGRIINNAAGANSYGAEISLTARLSKDFSLTANYGYTHATFKNDTLGYNGNFVPFAPQNTLSLIGCYNKNLTGKWIDRVHAQLQYNGAGRIYWTEQNDVYQDFYGLLNVRTGINKGIFGVNLWANNVLNQKYAVFLFESNLMGEKRNLAQQGKPFTFGIDVSILF